MMLQHTLLNCAKKEIPAVTGQTGAAAAKRVRQESMRHFFQKEKEKGIISTTSIQVTEHSHPNDG